MPGAQRNTNGKRIFITGSASGLGYAAAETLLGDGHEVIVHVRSESRLSAVQALVDQGAIAPIGDLSDAGQIRHLASQANEIGRMDAVIHNAGVMSGPNAPDDLRLGHLTQEWLAASDDREALTSGGYWHHQQRVEPHPAANDVKFQEQLLAELERATGTPLTRT